MTKARKLLTILEQLELSTIRECTDEELYDELFDADGNLKVDVVEESRKSQFVAKLIGLGILEKTPDGKLKVLKKVKKEDVIAQLKKA